jgi:hypothetical protein
VDIQNSPLYRDGDSTRRSCRLLGRRSLAVVLVCLLVGIPLPGATSPLGIVTQSIKGHLSTADASAGATIYDGDRLSTDAGGTLRLRTGSSSMYIAAQTSLTLHRAAAGALADLAGGSLIFSSAPASAIEIRARDARIRPAENVPTVAQVSVVGPKELLVTARRGALELAYRDETERIAEGASYRVLLDATPADLPPAANGRAPGSWPATPPQKAGKTGKALFLIVAGGAAWATAWALHEAVESPDQP